MSEQDLWIAVLQRQIDDALIMPAGIDNRSEARRAAIRDAGASLQRPAAIWISSAPWPALILKR